MIRARFFHADGKLCGVRIQGHAEAGPYGHDLVCAGVSALAIAIANGFCAQDLPYDVAVDDSGDGDFTITQTGPLDATQAIKARVLWDTLYQALRDMAASYGTHYLSIQKTRLKEVGICSK